MSTDTVGNADDIWTDTMGVLATAEMGKQLGEVADKVSDRAFLWSHALLRGLLRAIALRHRALHTGGEPDGNHRIGADDGGILAELVLLGRVSDGSKHRGFEVSEFGSRLGSLDDS